MLPGCHLFWFGFSLKSDATAGHWRVECHQEGTTSAPHGSPWPLLPQEAFCETPLAFQSGLRSRWPRERWRCVHRKRDLISGHVRAERKLTAGSFYGNVNKGDGLARGIGHGIRNSHLWATASNCVGTETVRSSVWGEVGVK